jgi:hypothetical protein
MQELVSVGVGFVVFLFLFWRRLKEDYESSLIFSTGFSMLIGIVAGLALTAFLGKPISQYGLWIAGVFATVAIAITARRFDLNLFEVLDATIWGSYFWVFIVSSTHAVHQKSPSSLLLAVLMVIAIILFVFLEENYKKFTWYKSGKKGFSSLVTLFLVVLSRIPIALSWPGTLTFIGKFDAIVSLVLAMSVLFVLYKRATK